MVTLNYAERDELTTVLQDFLDEATWGVISLKEVGDFQDSLQEFADRVSDRFDLEGVNE